MTKLHMDDPLVKALQYHDQAEQMRKLAASETHEQYRAGLLELADVYDKLSTILVEIGKEGIAVGGPNASEADGSDAPKPPGSGPTP